MQDERYSRFHAALTAVNAQLAGVYGRLTGGQGDAYCRWVCAGPQQRSVQSRSSTSTSCTSTSCNQLQQHQRCAGPWEVGRRNPNHRLSCRNSPNPLVMCAPCPYCSYTQDRLAAFADGVTFHVRWVGG